MDKNEAALLYLLRDRSKHRQRVQPILTEPEYPRRRRQRPRVLVLTLAIVVSTRFVAWMSRLDHATTSIRHRLHPLRNEIT